MEGEGFGGRGIKFIEVILQKWRPQLDAKIHVKMPKAVVYVCNHSPGKAKAGRPLGIAVQPIEFNGCVPGSRETLSLKTRWLRNDIRVDLCPLEPEHTRD